ncbi:TPA: DUF1176 domain-containing protein [Kluyvera ascorbata]|uniref:DUF1176 domain-containing protein n=1 Tax=Kluyvera ascorbata TaxID=51288 RepID=UPI0022DF597E|nr:DUF1176 domain-containing protein [Kluyvera ascorbata]HDG1682429.1 DUF1176 domain-containing protein [Kluyvera ascorbata]
MRYHVLLFFFCIGLLPTSLTWAAPAQQLFSDWLVTCNNQNFCVTRNVGLHHGLVMTLSRSAGAHTDAQLRIELGGLVNPVAAVPAIEPRLLLDGQPLKLTGEHWKVQPKLLTTGDSVTIDAFLQQIQDADAITLVKGVQVMSLKGLKAALLFIDAQQKRVGNETAWVRKGDEPPMSVPPAPALKSAVKAIPAPTPLSHDEYNDLLDFGTWRMNNNQCSLDPGRREVWVTALSDDKALIMTSCESGAYNTIYLAWLVSRKKPFITTPIRLRLPFLPAGSDSRDIELVNLTFNENSRELVTLDKARGLGDCGVQTRWRFDGQRFRLVRYAAQPECDNWQSADAWATQWVSG